MANTLKIHTIPGDHVTTRDCMDFQCMVPLVFPIFPRRLVLWGQIDLYPLHNGHYDPNLVWFCILITFYTHFDFVETNFHPCCSNSKLLGNVDSLRHKFRKIWYLSYINLGIQYSTIPSSPIATATKWNQFRIECHVDPWVDTTIQGYQIEKPFQCCYCK
jgi:hypothetical protein